MFTGTISPGLPQERDFPGRIAQGVEQLELRDVVLGDGGDVIVVGRHQQLEGKDHFLRPENLVQDVAESSGLLQALEVAVVIDECSAHLAFGLDDASRRRLQVGLGPRHVRGHRVLDAEQLDELLRRHAALLLDVRQVPQPHVARRSTETWGLMSLRIAPLVHLAAAALVHSPRLGAIRRASESR